MLAFVHTRGAHEIFFDDQAGVEDTEQMVKTQVAAEPAKASN